MESLTFTIDYKRDFLSAKNFLDIVYNGYLNSSSVNDVISNGGTVSYELEKNNIILLCCKYVETFEICDIDTEKSFYFDTSDIHSEENQENYEDFVKFYRGNNLHKNNESDIF